MEDISKYIATISNAIIPADKITNNAEIIINNVKILIKTSEEELHITKNQIININYYDDKNLIFIYYFNTNRIINTKNRNGNKLFIKFDEQSNSAYKAFIQNIKEFNKVKGILYYESGNDRMEGEFILDEENGRYSANGKAKVYYDSIEKELYYEGEIENENYDGSGIIYNKTGNISLHVNNIDQNNPIGTGKLIIKDFSDEIYYEKEFLFDDVDDIDFTNFNLDEFVEKYNSDSIFNDLDNYSNFKYHYNIDYNVNKQLEITKNELLAEGLIDVKDKQTEMLYRKVVELDLKMNDMIKMINEIHTKITTEPRRTGFFG